MYIYGMGYSEKSIADHLGRTFGTLRVSLNNSCNLECVYCVNPAVKRSPTLKHKENKLSEKQLIDAIYALHQLTPFHTLRITGGEPTMYKGLITFVEKMKHLGIPHIKMTTNASLLESMVPGLIEAGLTEINVSLDAVDPEIFYLMSGKRNLHKTIRGIDAALRHNLPVKLNAVIVKGINDREILPLLNFGRSRNITLRFLELMKMGHLYSRDFDRYFFSQENILARISGTDAVFPLERRAGATANYWRTNDKYVFGIIANESSPFCQDCDRLRLDHNGNIYGCLSDNKGHAIANVVDREDELREVLRNALGQKQEKHFTGSTISMIDIGG
jgi:cyclic pyranopterin phosphate synthase